MVYRRRRMLARRRRYRARSSYKKRKYLRRRRRRVTFKRPAGNIIFPTKKRIVLRYADRHSGSTTALGSYIYRANSLYDPNYTAAGHQPRGFDQMALFYQQYEVIAARIRVICSVPNSNRVYDDFIPGQQQFNPAIKFWVASSAVNAGLTENDLDESPRMVSGVIAPGTQRTLTLTVYNRTMARDPSDRIAGTGGNPNFESYFYIAHQPHQNGFSGVGYAYTVIIDYYCEFSDPITIGQS